MIYFGGASKHARGDSLSVFRALPVVCFLCPNPLHTLQNRDPAGALIRVVKILRKERHSRQGYVNSPVQG